MSLFLILAEVETILERIIKSFLCEGNKGNKINHLVKWELTWRIETEKYGPSCQMVMETNVWNQFILG